MDGSVVAGALDQRVLTLLAALARATTLEQVAEAVSQHAAAAVGAARTAVVLVGVDGRPVSILTGLGVGMVDPEVSAAPAPLIDTASRGEPRWYPSLGALGADYPALGADQAPQRDGAWVCVPLDSDGQRVGAVEWGYAAPRAFDADDRARLAAVAEQVAIAIARSRLVGDLQQALRLTDEVVGILGHDLRNPLHAIILTTENLLADPDNGPRARTLLRIRNGAERMARMVDQLFDLAKVRLGDGLRVEPSAMDLAELVRQHVEDQQLVAEQPIEIEIRGDTVGSWDRDRLAQALVNLLDNAVHHGDRDAAIEVELDGGGDEVLLSVWNGGAIPTELLPVVFEPFRGRRDGQRRGLGLGLYIVREVVRAHGGSITVRSSLLSGTTFLIALPRHAAASRA